MANESLAVSARRRNLILENAASKASNLSNKCSGANDFELNYLNELETLIGLAFTAILAEGNNIDASVDNLNIFIQNKKINHHTYAKNEVIHAISHLLLCSFSAFKTLGYPYYYDDFIWAYHSVLNSPHYNLIPPEIRYEMKRMILSID